MPGLAGRLPPGDGQIDLPAIPGRLALDLPIALEVPMTAFTREAGTEAVVRRVREAAGRLLQSMAGAASAPAA